MSDKLKVNPAELRASAHAADTISKDMKQPNNAAVKESGAAADSMHGWSISGALQEIADSWKGDLNGLHDRAASGASNLRSSAAGHEWNESLISKNFEGMRS